MSLIIFMYANEHFVRVMQYLLFLKALHYAFCRTSFSMLETCDAVLELCQNEEQSVSINIKLAALLKCLQFGAAFR